MGALSFSNFGGKITMLETIVDARKPLLVLLSYGSYAAGKALALFQVNPIFDTAIMQYGAVGACGALFWWVIRKSNERENLALKRSNEREDMAAQREVEHVEYLKKLLEAAESREEERIGELTKILEANIASKQALMSQVGQMIKKVDA